MNKNTHTPLDLFFDQLRDLYSLEVQLRDSMSHLTTLCTDDALLDLILTHAQETEIQIEELTMIFDRHGESPGGDHCKAMAGLIRGGTAHLEGVKSTATRDLMMIAHCLRIEYYALSAYEFTTTLSGRLGLWRERKILNQALSQEMGMAAALMALEPGIFEMANASYASTTVRLSPARA